MSKISSRARNVLRRGSYPNPPRSRTATLQVDDVCRRSNSTVGLKSSSRADDARNVLRRGKYPCPPRSRSATLQVDRRIDDVCRRSNSTVGLKSSSRTDADLRSGKYPHPPRPRHGGMQMDLRINRRCCQQTADTAGVRLLAREAVLSGSRSAVAANGYR